MKKLTLMSCLLFTLPFSALANADEAVEAKSNQCGIISVYKQPPAQKNIYFVNIDSIDGVPVKSGSHGFQLSPGPHKIKVIEKIQDSYFTRRRGEMKNYHVMDIMIEADKKYYLGAKFIRKNRSKLKTGEYWDAIVWKESNKDCSFS